jgi:hypothetical protein
MKRHRIGVMRTNAGRQLVAFGLAFIAVVTAGCGGEEGGFAPAGSMDLFVSDSVASVGAKAVP